MVIHLEWGADLHMAQLIPLPLTVSCFSKIQIGFTFLVPAHLGKKDKGIVFPYSLPSVGPGADPGVQAVSPQVTWSESCHRPGSGLPLLSARPAVPERITFKVATLTYRALHGSAPPCLASSFTCVADMPHRRTDAGSGPPPLNSLTFRPPIVDRRVNYRRSCLSCCWSKGVEWPAKRCYVGLVAVGVQEQAEDILVPPLFRNCLTFNYIPLF